MGAGPECDHDSGRGEQHSDPFYDRRVWKEARTEPTVTGLGAHLAGLHVTIADAEAVSLHQGLNDVDRNPANEEQ